MPHSCPTRRSSDLYANGVLGHSDILKIGPTFIREQALMRRIVSRRYPVIFVDESQDTDPDFVAALRIVANETQNGFCVGFFGDPVQKIRSEEHTSELQSLMRISYAVFCLKK